MKYLGCFDDEFTLFEIEMREGLRRFALYRLISTVDVKDVKEEKQG